MEVTVSKPAAVYAYEFQNILIIYLIAIVPTCIALFLGMFAFHASGVCHDTSFSSIACATHGIHFSDLRAHENLGGLPRPQHVTETMLKFNMDGSSGCWGFSVAERDASSKIPRRRRIWCLLVPWRSGFANRKRDEIQRNNLEIGRIAPAHS